MPNKKMVRRSLLATLAIGGCVSTLAAQPASAATPACGPTCLSVFSKELGSYAQPNFVEHVFGGVASAGTPTGLTTISGSDTSEDFINPHPGTVSDYYAIGLVSAAVNDHYGPMPASQLEYAPAGVPSGLCVGVADVPYQNEALSLQPCTVPGRTVWIIGSSPTTPGYFPIISGATDEFSQPFAMSYPRHVDTSDQLPPIRLRQLQFLGKDGVLADTQLWGVKRGPVQ
jgi:hypothetical protein